MKQLLQLMLCGAAVCGAANVYAEEALIFEETFSNCKSTTIQGGYFAESLYFESAMMGDHDGWYTQNCYESERAIKFSAKTKHGKATSPELPIIGNSGDLKVCFRAQTWRGDELTVNVEVNGEVRTVDLAGTSQITDRSNACSEVTFTDVPAGSKLIFYGTGKEGGTGVTRFFLSDIRVFQEVPDGTAPGGLSVTASYHHFDDIMCGNESELRTVTACGAGSEHGDPVLTLPENSNFEIVSAVSCDCEYPVTTWDLRFNPRSAGSKEEVATITLGDLTHNLILTGNAKVYRPASVSAQNVSATGFEAAWPTLAGMDAVDVAVWELVPGELVASDLMITKYIEGRSNNRALEIYNGTAGDVNLNGYKLRMETNGAGGLTSSEYALPDKVLERGKCFTICNAQFSALRDIADVTIGYQDGGYANITTFTGDDAIGLFNPDDELIDIVGYESPDTNDLVSGDWGADASFYRRSDTCYPTAKFYPEEWEKHEMDYCEGYGQHKMDATGQVRKQVKAVRVDNPADGKVAIDGLEEGHTYYVAIRGISNGHETHYCHPVEVKTTASGVSAVGEDAQPWTLDGDLLTLADGAKAYTLQGVCLGTGTIRLSGHGVVIIRTATRASKLVY